MNGADDNDKSDPNPVGGTCFLLLGKPCAGWEPRALATASMLEGCHVLPAKGLVCLLTWLQFGSLNSQGFGLDTGWLHRGGLQEMLLQGRGMGCQSVDIK